MVDHCTGNGHSLFLAAGELAGIKPCTLLEPDFAKRLFRRKPADNQQAIFGQTRNAVSTVTNADNLAINDRNAIRVVAITAAVLIQKSAGVDAAQSIIGDTLLCQRISRAAAADKHTLRIQDLDHISDIAIAGNILQNDAVAVLVHIAVFIEHIFIAAGRRNDLFSFDGNKTGVENGIRLQTPESLQFIHLILSQKDIGDPAETPRLKHRISKGLAKLNRYRQQ